MSSLPQHRQSRSGEPPSLLPAPFLRTPFASGLTVVLFLASGASAQESETTEPQTERVETEITVTATFPELAPVDLVGRRELEERGGSDLVDALRYESGVSAARRGAVNLDVSIRGLQETQVTTLVDGTRTYAAGPARMDSELSHVTPNAVERIEIVKGPYALTWGPGSMSAIDVRTYRPSFSTGAFDLGGRAAVDATSNADAADAFGQIHGASERVRFDLLVNYREGGDYESGGGVEIPGDYTSEDYLWSVGTRLGDSATLDYRGGYQAQDHLDFPGRLLDATYFRTRSHQLAWSWTGDRGALDGLSATVYSNRKDHRMNNDEKPTALDMPGRVPPFGLRVDLPTESNTSGGRGSAELSWGDTRIKVGVDATRSEQNARRFVSRRSNDFLIFEDIVWPDAQLDDDGAYGQVIWSGDLWELGFTGRLDRWEADAGEVSAFFLANTSGELDREETFASAAISGRFQLGDGWSLSAGLGSAPRTPTTLELYSDRFPSTKFQIAAEFLGNPALEPERSLELDVGVLGAVGGGTFSLDLYARRIDDYITLIPDPDVPKRLPLSPPTVYRLINGDEARFVGGELRYEQPLGDRFRWRGGVSWVHGTEETAGATPGDEPVLGIAPLHGQLGLRVHSRDRSLWGDVTLTVVDDQNRVAASRAEIPTDGYELVSLRGGWQWSEGFELYGAVENVTDEEYTHHLNSLNPFTRERIPEMGRSVTLGVRVRR